MNVLQTNVVPQSSMTHNKYVMNNQTAATGSQTADFNMMISGKQVNGNNQNEPNSVGTSNNLTRLELTVGGANINPHRDSSALSPMNDRSAFGSQHELRD